MKKKLISWIVPAFNVEKFIIECLKSLVSVGLSEDSYEILVINDGSTDNTKDLIKEFATSYKSVRVFTQDNRGVSFTRNRAIEMANGIYIHFVDSDDYIINGEYYIDCIKYAIDNDLDILTFGYERNRDSAPKIESKECSNTHIDKLAFSDIMSGPSLWEAFSFVNTVWNYIIKRDYIIEHNLRFEYGVILEDFKFNINAFYSAERCVNTKISLYSYRYNANSLMHNTSLEEQLKMLDFYIANAKYSVSFLENKGANLSDGARQVIYERCNRMSLWGLMRAFKIDRVRYFIKELRKNNLYPFEWMTRPEYQMKKVKLFYHISQHEYLTIFLSKLYKLYIKCNPNAFQFDNW